MVHWPPSGCVHTANPSPLPGIRPPKPEPQLPAPTWPPAGEQTSLSAGECWLAPISVRESLCFALCTPVAVLSSVAPKIPLPPPQSPLVKGLPSVWKVFLLHSSLPEVQVLSVFFCLCFFLFLLPYPGMWGVSCLLGSLRPSASIQWVFYRSCSTCRCISDVFVGRKVISTSYSSSILKVHSTVFVDASF